TWHDSRLRGDKDFKVGDQVLLYNSHLKMCPGKLKSKWSGPNIVKTVYPHRAIEITNRDGFSFKVNGQRLKKYYGGDIDKEDDEIWDNEDIHDLGSVETEFPAIVFNDALTSKAALSCEPTVSSLNDEIDFRISFDKSDDEDCTLPSLRPIIYDRTIDDDKVDIGPLSGDLSVQLLPDVIKYDKLKDEAQAKNEDFLNKLDDSIKKIIKNQVKEQVKAQVSKILPKIEKTVNEQLKAEIMTHSSTKSKTSLATAANLSELELKKILIEKMESNKRRDDKDKDEEPSAGSNQGSKRRRAGKESESTSTPKEKTPKSTGKSIEGSKSLCKSAGESAHAEEPMHTAIDLEEPAHQEFETGATEDQPVDETPQSSDCNLTREEGPRKSFDELMDTPLDFSAFMMNRLKVDTLTPELLASPTFELMKGTCKIILFNHFINNDLTYLSGGVSSRTYATSVTKTKAADYGHIKWIKDLVPNTMWSDVPNHCNHKTSDCEWHGYKHLDWITVHRDDDKLYTFKEGDFKRLRLQDIEDMLILLAQGKLTNLNVEDRLAFGVSLRMFTRSIVIQRRVEDLQLGVESYQKKLNITKPDTYRSDLKRRDAYTAYSNPRGFIYQNKDKKNKLMRIDELHKFSDGTLDDVRTALNDRLKGIRMEYLPQTIWRQSDRERAKAMIQAIDKQLKSRRIMRSLERFVGGRPYGGDLRLLQRTI
ncbi:hypothetical protein Tco_0846115, partial [Tanacetum coccineum]